MCGVVWDYLLPLLMVVLAGWPPIGDQPLAVLLPALSLVLVVKQRQAAWSCGGKKKVGWRLAFWIRSTRCDTWTPHIVGLE